MVRTSDLQPRAWSQVRVPAAPLHSSRIQPWTSCSHTCASLFTKQYKLVPTKLGGHYTSHVTHCPHIRGLTALAMDLADVWLLVRD